MKVLFLSTLITVYSLKSFAVCTVNLDSNAYLPESSDVKAALFHHGYDLSPAAQNKTIVLKYETKLLGEKCDGAQIGQTISCSVDAQLVSDSKQVLASGSYSNIGCVNAMSSDFAPCGGYAQSFVIKNLPKCDRWETDFEDLKFFNASSEDVLITNENYFTNLVHLNNNRAYFPIRFGDRLIRFEISKEKPGSHVNLPEKEKTPAFLSSVDAKTGKELWRTEYKSLGQYREVISTWVVRAVRINNVLVLGWGSQSDGGIRAININTGATLWEKPNWPNTMFIAGGEVLFLPHPSNGLTAIYAQSGKPFWRHKFEFGFRDKGGISDGCTNMASVYRYDCPLLKDGKLNIKIQGWDGLSMFYEKWVLDAKTGEKLSQHRYGINEKVEHPREGMP